MRPTLRDLTESYESRAHGKGLLGHKAARNI
jgi:hypothetical protein